jgi:hypothetical protein
MRSVRRRLSRRELGLVAAALLVPLPIFVATGLSAPLPNAIERALGGLVVIEAQDEQTGSSATVAGSEDGRGAKRSANGSLAVTSPRGGRAARQLPTSAVSGLLTPATDQNGTGGDANTQPQQEGSPDQNGGRTGSPEQPAEPGPADDSTSGNPAEDGTAPSAQIGASGQGTGVAVSVGPSGVRVDAGADSEGTGSDAEGDAGVTVTAPDGSSSGVGLEVPGIGLP